MQLLAFHRIYWQLKIKHTTKHCVEAVDKLLKSTPTLANTGKVMEGLTVIVA